MTNETVILHKYMPAWGQPDMSPFCAKVEVYLRMAGIPYSVKVADSRKAPRQKLPVAEIDGKRVPDSSQIIAYLEAKRGMSMDARLSPREQAIAAAVRAMLEEHFYYVLVYLRWQDDQGWSAYSPLIEAHQAELGRPGPVRSLITVLSRQYMKATLHRQGMGRYPREDVIAIGKTHMETVAELMSDGPYFFGEAPSTLDATVYAMVANLLGSAYDCPLKDFAATRAPLSAYCERIRKQYFLPAYEQSEVESVSLGDPILTHR